MFPTVHGVVSQAGRGQAPPPPAGYRYHRLTVTANNGRSTLNIAEMELRETPGGGNAASGGSAQSSNHFSTNFHAGLAFDGDPDTYWSSLASLKVSPETASASSQFSNDFPAANAFTDSKKSYWSTATGVTSAWLQADFGNRPMSITSYSIRARAGSGVGDGAPQDWTLEYSDDGSTWSVADTVTGETGWGSAEVRNYQFDGVGRHRYWRLNITDNNGRSTINVSELMLFSPWWIQYDQDVGNTIAVAQYVIQARADAGDGAPKDWKLEGSNDLETWDTLDTVTGETGWSNGETRVFTL